MTCATCRYWGWPEEEPYYGYKTCQLFSDWDRLDGVHPLSDDDRRLARRQKARVSPFAGADGATFDTRPDFGCTQHSEMSPPLLKPGEGRK